ncbi:hypothetical protein NP233_g7935 [Leucocoprinus birnbaumii]|uniref:Uncharacterized protein n=1 Tax=Leucocoprinus birnbaumii TaxID=56174 RepID=A0AAD5VPX9_9AGAR|nr:hypothetical protein NP233_g7935 [Leucocoprinus birnbaumii]
MGMLRGKGPKPELSSSPRPSTATTTGRPSAESSRSFLNSKRSFDTSTSSITHPRGALYALAQESLSTSSLGRPPHPGRQEGLRGKFSLGRLRSHSSTVDIPSSPDSSAARLPQNSHSTIASPSPRPSCDTTASSTLDVQTGLHALFVDRRSDKGFHPYASPDVVSYSTEPPLKSPIRTTLPYPEAPRKDSNTTVVELSSFAAPVKQSAPTPEALKRRLSHIQGKDISGPVSILSPDSPTRPQFDEPLSVPPTTHNIPGWTERSNINPGFSLISLEEARAQRRTATLPQTHESTSSGDSSTTTAIETSTTDAGHLDLAAARARARSVSAGTKAKNALSSFVWQQPERRGSENGLVTGGQPSAARDANATPAAGKAIKHKKSGFMRLFSNGKANEKEPPPIPQPPSIPSLPQSEAPAFIPRHNPKLSSHRIPVPSLSPSLLEAAAQYNNNQELTDLVIDVSPSRSTQSPKRAPPHALSISTSSPLSASPRGHFAGSSKYDGVPQSAPPNVGDFPALKLRPVSTLFSAHFGDHIDVTKLNFDELEGIGPTETREAVLSARRQNERQRQDSLTSGSLSSGPSSASAASFIDSQYNLSPIAPSFSGTALTTPTTGGIVSPTSSSTTGPWIRDREHAGLNNSGRFSVDQQSAPPSLPTSANSASNAPQHVVRETEETSTIRVLQEHLDNTNKMWQKRVWDLESEVRALKNELAEVKLLSKSSCEKCGGKGSGVPPVPPLPTLRPDGGILNRPRAKTGSSARFVNGQL